LLALVLNFLPVNALANSIDVEQHIDRIFEQWNTAASPGCAVGVAEDGRTVLERAYGMADLEHDIPNTPETIFEGGSVAKQFTAGAVILLAIEGELSLEDDVRKYVPEVPDYGFPITLRQLMTHTSGLRDWGSVASISGWGRGYRTHNHDHVLDIVGRQTALNFEPGQEYSYSNTGFNLLAIVVSRVSGLPFAEFSRLFLFEPLGMRNTEWRADYRKIVKGRSSAYTALDDGSFALNRPIEDVHGNGGILTTVGDLLVWTQNLVDGRVGGAEFVRRMHEPGRLRDGAGIRYAGGLMTQTFAGVPAVVHTGSTAGYRAFLGRYPDQDLTVAMLCNVTNVPTADTGGRIARVFLGDAAVDSVPPTGIGLSSTTLQNLAGFYVEPVTGSVVQWHMDGDALWVGDKKLVPLSETMFTDEAGDQQIVLSIATGGGRPTYSLETWQHRRRFEPIELWQPNETELRAFAGTYESDDAETTFVVTMQDGALMLWRRPNQAVRMMPIYSDGFKADDNVLRFRRDGSGRITGMSLSRSRVYDMRFGRAEREKRRSLSSASQ
jgi:CubicO group peptidase (beta-lactamase class C family)